MKVLGLIVEYNPFHQGHLYHINKAKQLIKPDVTIVIMSGHFVQRGEPAISNKWTRAGVAIKNGIDLVIELPFVYSVQSADYFAQGAIELLAKLKVTDIVFGSECGNINIFKDIAFTIKNNQKNYDNLVKKQMNQGLRYPDACNQALSILMNKTVTLDIESISSASAIRHALKNKIDISNQFCNYEDYQEFYFFDDFYPFLRYKILTTDAPTLKHLHLVDEGIENLLKEKVVITNHMDELITSLTSKRYTRSRIQRMLIHILMNNSKEDIAEAMQIDYIRVLKMNNVGQAYLNKIKKSCEYKLVTNFSSYHHPALELEFRATKLLSCLSKNPNQLISLEYKSIPK